MAPERPEEVAGRTASAPGDIGRGTQETGTAKPAQGGSPSEDFAARQSFADPAHRGGSPVQAPDSVPSGEGGIRTQETGSEEGARTPRRQATTSTSRDSLDALQEGHA